MSFSRVFIKANYIKKAKDDWVHCDGHVLTHDKLSILKLTSINTENIVNEVDTIKRFNSLANGLKVLLNLSEFKSSEIKPVNFRNSERFAIKLIPSGILHKKKLWLVPENEDDLNKWYSLLADHVHKSKESEKKGGNKPEEVKKVTLKSNDKKDVLISNQEKSEDPNPLLESIEAVEKNDEIYFTMDDNDVYDGNSLENSYTICIDETSDSKRLDLKGSFILRLKEEGLELADIKMGDIIHKFPYIFIRRFGAKNDILRLEAGRKCTTGEGYLMFRFKDAQKAVEIIRELVRELKKSVSNSQADCSNLDSGHRNSMAMSIISGTPDFDNEPSFTRNNWSTSTISPYNVTPNSVVSSNEGDSKHRFFSQESCSTMIKSPPPAISPKPQHVKMPFNGIQKQVSHPLYTSISSTHNGRASPAISNLTNVSRHNMTASRPPIVNNNFNRSNQVAASFSYNRPVQVQIPVTKISQDDNYCRKVNGSAQLYDNLPRYDRQNDRGKYVSHNANSSVKYSSSYLMHGPLTNRDEGNYDNVPNNQRCIQELETMLNDLGIPSH